MKSESETAGYAGFMARYRCQQMQKKRLVGKPTIMLMQGCIVASYSFQLGSILGSKHRDHPAAFMAGFLGLEGPENAAQALISGYSNTVQEQMKTSETFSEYAIRNVAAQMGASSDLAGFAEKYGAEEILIPAAEEFAWDLAAEGMVLGFEFTDEVRPLFESSYQVDPEMWNAARSAGLSIPEDPDVIQYDEFETNENTLFLEYCKEFKSDVYQALR